MFPRRVPQVPVSVPVVVAQPAWNALADDVVDHDHPLVRLRLSRLVRTASGHG
jgi:hypothetical protein